MFDFFFFFFFAGPSTKKLQLIQDQLHETSSQAMIVSVDRVFSGSARLDGDAIGRFCLSSNRFDFLLFQWPLSKP